MRIELKNLGPLRQAEFSLGDLTILCGKNNTGKSYATYALYGFLMFWREAFSIEIGPEQIRSLLDSGTVRLDLAEYQEHFQEWLDRACRLFAKEIPIVLGGQERNLSEATFRVTQMRNEIHSPGEFDRTWGSSERELLHVTKAPGDNTVTVSLLVGSGKRNGDLPDGRTLEKVIGPALRDMVFGDSIPDAFIACAERTGIATFRNELNLPASEMLDRLHRREPTDNVSDIVRKAYRRHPLPVVRNLEFSKSLEKVAETEGNSVAAHRDVLRAFDEMAGGGYTVGQDGLYFAPSGSSGVRLTMKESSSAVRSLIDMGFYLRHVAEKGQLLIVDEPELNLHPANQRRMARLLARLVNLGIRVYITTHSDYIIKEINTLIMLNRDLPHLSKIRERYRYEPDELLEATKVKAYVAQEEPASAEGREKSDRSATLVPCEVTQEMGIEAKSFDPTILEMNHIQESIIFGMDE